MAAATPQEDPAAQLQDVVLCSLLFPLYLTSKVSPRLSPSLQLELGRVGFIFSLSSVQCYGQPTILKYFLARTPYDTLTGVSTNP